MRKKYLPIYAVSLFLLILGLAGLYGYLTLAKPIRVKRIFPVRPIAPVQVPDQKTLDEMATLQDRMGDLLRPVPENAQPVSLRAFGYIPVHAGKMRKGGGGPGLIRGDSHLLTMAFKGMARGFCVIDGTFYQQGASLPDGSVIRRVERNRVLLVKRKQKVWIDMIKADPFREQDARKTGDKE